jgi:hypothetical protein
VRCRVRAWRVLVRCSVALWCVVRCSRGQGCSRLLGLGNRGSDTAGVRAAHIHAPRTRALGSLYNTQSDECELRRTRASEWRPQDAQRCALQPTCPTPAACHAARPTHHSVLVPRNSVSRRSSKQQLCRPAAPAIACSYRRGVLPSPLLTDSRGVHAPQPRQAAARLWHPRQPDHVPRQRARGVHDSDARRALRAAAAGAAAAAAGAAAVQRPRSAH